MVLINLELIEQGVKELGLPFETVKMLEMCRSLERPIEAYERQPYFQENYKRYLEMVDREMCFRKNARDPKKIKSLLMGLHEVGDLDLWIDRVIFNDPATIVIWEDGSKTIVKCGKHDKFDKEKGLAMAIIKKLYGNTGKFNNLFKELDCYGLEEPAEEKPSEESKKAKKTKAKAKTEEPTSE